MLVSKETEFIDGTGRRHVIVVNEDDIRMQVDDNNIWRKCWPIYLETWYVDKEFHIILSVFRQNFSQVGHR